MQIISNKKQPVTDALLYINAEVTRKNYRRRLELFFEYIGMEGEDLDAQGQAFLDQARENPEWAQHQIMRFLNYQKQRVLVKKDMAASTLKNFYKPIKFFCSIHRDIQNNID